MLAALFIGLASTGYANPVTAIAPYAGSVYVGRADGAVERLGPHLTVQSRYSKPTGVPVSFIAASPYGIAWLNGQGGAIREKAAPSRQAEQTLTICFAGKAVALTIQPAKPVRRLAWLGGRIAVCFDFGSAFYDAKGNMVSPKSFMPVDAADLAGTSSLWVREQEDGNELALFARPHAVRLDPRNQKAPLVSLFTAYRVGAWQWDKLGGFASNAFDAFPDGVLQASEEGRLGPDAKFMVLSDRIGLAQDGIVAKEPDSLINVPIFEKDWEIARVDAAAAPGDPLWFGAAGDDAWWWNGVALVQQNRRTGRYAIYMPWSDPHNTPYCLAAHSSGLWIGSNRGLRFLDPAQPDDQTGFAGFVRVEYGIAATKSQDPNAKKLTDAIFAWRFADSEKAGADGGAMVSSIFSALGIKLPQTAAELMKVGTPVPDELRFGDVLLTDKRAAVYLSNGITVEVRGGRVQNGDIWAFPNATVRRFAP
ncbi:MAG: hypothetical protein ACHQ50_04155 [Fimbriimonadales bacterium]